MLHYVARVETLMVAKILMLPHIAQDSSLPDLEVPALQQ